MTTWVLLRGLARESQHWGSFTQLLKGRLSGTETLITLDLPGTGRLHESRSPASVRKIAEHCRLGLRAYEPTFPLILVGLSLGGLVALEWSRLAPEEVAGCVMINSSVGRASPPWLRLRPGNYRRLARLLFSGMSAAEREREILAMTSSRHAEHADVAGSWASIAAQRPVSRGNVLRQLLAAACYRSAKPAPVPVLLLASVHDNLVSCECTRALAAQWKAPLAVHPFAGHDLPLDSPAWVARQMTDWWQSRVSRN